MISFELPQLRQEFNRHRRKWQSCTRCRIGVFAKYKCLVRGTLPCSVLFVGEAPGKSEDVIGEPFVGRSGKLLDHWIEKSMPEGCRWSITNITACRPTDCIGGSNRKPTNEEVHNCSDRLDELLHLAQPKVVVLLGHTAADTWRQNGGKKTKGIRTISVWHPAYVLRNGGAKSEASELVIKQLKEFLRG